MAQLVSVCLPVWNGANFVEAAIRTVLAQTHSDLELIIIDDCSEDQSANIVDRLAKEDERIRFYRNKSRLGLFENYNKCMELSKGNYIKPFAQDDLLETRTIELLLKLIESQSNLALASCSRQWIDSEGRLISSNNISIPTASDIFSAGQQIERSKLLQCSIFPIVNLIGEPAAVLFPRKFIGEGFDTRYKHLGDLEYWLRLLENGNFICTSEKLCSIREHSKRQTARNIRSLAIASDYVELAKNIAPSVTALGYSRESFFRNVLLELAQHLNYMIGTNTEEFISEISASQNPLYEVTLHSLLMIANSNQEVLHPGMKRRLEINDRHIVRQERYLRRLLSDPGWYLTRPLRELNRIFSFQTCPDAFPENTSQAKNSADNNTRALLQQQNSYLHYLTRMNRKVRLSRSWRLVEGLGKAGRTICKYLGLKTGNTTAAPLFDQMIYRSRSAKLAARKVYAETENFACQIFNELTSIYADSEITVQQPDLEKYLQKLNGPFKETYLQLADIEPLLPLAATSKNFSKYLAPKVSESGRAYFDLANLIDRPFTHLILMGNTASDQSAKLAFDLARRTTQSSDDVLILFSDAKNAEIENSKNYRSIVLNSINKNLDKKSRVHILVRLVLQAAPMSVMNVGSEVAWLAFRDYHRQLKKFTRLESCIADDFQYLTKSVLANLNWSIDFIDKLFVASENTRNFIVERLSLEPCNQSKILLSRYTEEQPECINNSIESCLLLDFSPAPVEQQIIPQSRPIGGVTN